MFSVPIFGTFDTLTNIGSFVHAIRTKMTIKMYLF